VKIKKAEKKTKHDDHNSSSGRCLFSTWLYSGDRDGKDLRYAKLGDHVVRAKETRCHAPAPVSFKEGEEALLEKRAQRKKVIDKLTELERAVFEMQGKLKTLEWVRTTIVAGDLVAAQREGFSLVPGTAREEERANVGVVQVVDVIGQEYVETEVLNREEIAAELGVSLHQVKRAIVSANKKLRGLDA